ncbi:MAG: hypothetical protein ACSHW0_19130, partial [Thalassotalea sp.]
LCENFYITHIFGCGGVQLSIARKSNTAKHKKSVIEGSAYPEFRLPIVVDYICARRRLAVSKVIIVLFYQLQYFDHD